MNQNIPTILVDAGVLLLLVALSLGLWYCPWITAAVIALVCVLGAVIGRRSG